MTVLAKTQSNRMLNLAVTLRSAGSAPATQQVEAPKCQIRRRNPVPSDGESGLKCCIACLRSAAGIDDELCVNNVSWTRNCSRSSVKITPPPTTTIDKCMPKARNRKAATMMHRKSKSKSKSNGKRILGSGIATHIRHFDSISTSTSITHHQQPHQQPPHQQQHQQPQPQPKPKPKPRSPSTTSLTTSKMMAANPQHDTEISTRSKHESCKKKKKSNSVRCKMLVPLPTLGATSIVTLLTIICIETVLLSTMSSCAKTFYMHWNTSNSIFRIDNTDHIIDVNKGNLAFEFDQVHIICPVYEPGAFENETEKYIIYNVSKVEYETCRITNADPRVIAICDKPQKLMFFTITFRPFTPQPGGLEFLPGNDYYFISTSSKDDLYRRIGGRCSTNNMKVVFKVCCAAEEKNKTTPETTLMGSLPGEGGISGSVNNGVDAGANVDLNLNMNSNHNGHNGHGVNTIGISGVNTGQIAGGANGAGAGAIGGGGMQLKPINGLGTSINTNIDHFNRIPMQPNIIGNNIGAAGVGTGTGGIMLTPGHGSINMLPPGRGGVHMSYPGHHHIQTGIRINNVPTQQQNNQHPHHKDNSNVNSNDDHHGYDKHPNEVVKNEELTYNSGSARATRNRIDAYAWIWIWIGSWLPGAAAAMALPNVYRIRVTMLLAILVMFAINMSAERTPVAKR